MDPKQKQFSIWYVFIAIWALMLFQIFVTPFFNPSEIPYSEFKAAVAADKVEEVAVSSTMIHGRMKPESATSGGSSSGARVGPVFNTVRVEEPDLLRIHDKQHVMVTGTYDKQ